MTPPEQRSDTQQTAPVAFVTSSGEETAQFGQELGEGAQPATVIALVGDLASGKTTLAKGIALGAGVPAEEYVTSPAYDLVHEYEGRLRVFHMDFYRIDSLEPEDYEWIWEYFSFGGLCVIEWADKLISLLPESYLRIDMDYGEGQQERRLTCQAIGNQAEDLLALVRRQWSS